jgi:hypothetical protein
VSKSDHLHAIRVDSRSHFDHQENVIEVAQIALRLEELEKQMVAVERERDEYRTLYLKTMERCRKLELGLLSSKSEHLPDGAQLSLDVLAMVLGERQRAELDAALAAANAEQ